LGVLDNLRGEKQKPPVFRKNCDTHLGFLDNLGGEKQIPPVFRKNCDTQLGFLDNLGGEKQKPPVFRYVNLKGFFEFKMFLEVCKCVKATRPYVLLCEKLVKAFY
jgi:hypothetical protein